MSGNHRLDDSKAERKRCERGGAEIARSELEGKPVGPLRVWPGGLAMSRTLGDYEVRLKSSTVVLAGLRLALVLAGISRCPVWLSQAFLWHARAYWGVISCFRPDAGISDVEAHLDSLTSWAWQVVHCLMLYRTASHQHAHCTLSAARHGSLANMRPCCWRQRGSTIQTFHQ